MARPRELLALVLDAPREAGTPAAAHARRLVADHLRTLGYNVEEQPFTFFPSSLNALPMFGAGLGWLTLIQIPLVTVPGAPPWAALAAWVVGLGALAMLVRGTALGWSSLGGGVREDANLIATRGDAPVRRWIVAHLDTKAQGHSMAGRVVGAVVALAGARRRSVRWPSSGSGDRCRATRCRMPPYWRSSPAGSRRAAPCAAPPRGRGTTGRACWPRWWRRSAAPPEGVGILITGAEEFGLVGARIFAREYGPQLVGVEVINLDTIDDQGKLYVVSHDATGARWSGSVAGALAGVAPDLKERRQPLWAYVDSRPLSQTGAAALTVARLDWGTLRRMHTPRDTPAGMEFTTAEAVGRLVAGPI